MKEIYIYGDFYSKVDDNTYNHLNQFKWYLIGPKRQQYISRNIVSPNGKHTTIRIHQEIFKMKGIKIPENMEIDHKDRDIFNNQFENLRIVTGSVNSHNRKLPITNTSGIKGISFDTWHNKWKAHITIRGIKRHLGYFLTFEEATLSRLAAEDKYKDKIGRL